MGKKICKPLFRDLHFLCELFRSRIIKFYVIWLKSGVFRLFAHSFRPRPPFKPIFSFSMIFHIHKAGFDQQVQLVQLGAALGNQVSDLVQNGGNVALIIE